MAEQNDGQHIKPVKVADRANLLIPSALRQAPHFNLDAQRAIHCVKSSLRRRCRLPAEGPYEQMLAKLTG